MPHPFLPRPLTRMAARHRSAALTITGITTVAITVAAQWPAWSTTPFAAALNVFVSLTFVLTGLLLLDEDALDSVSSAFVLGGVLWTASWAATWEAGPSAVLSSFAYTHFWVCLGWGVLRYPSGRLHDNSERVLLGTAVAVIPVGNLVLIALSRPESFGYAPGVWWYGSAIDPGVFDIVVHTLDALTLAVVVAFGLAIARRYRRASALERRTLGPVSLGVLAAFAIAAVVNLFVYYPQGAEIDPIFIPIALALFAIPVAFAVAAVRRHLARARIAQLLSGLSTPPTPAAVREVLRAAVGDDGAELYLWMPERGFHVDADGLPAVPPTAGGTQLALPVRTTAGAPLAVLSARSSLERDRDLVEVALNASAIALENARLHATVTAQLDAVRATRTRLVEAGLAERRRIERDLHDGAQQRLLALSARLGLAREQSTDQATVAALEGAREDLRAALAELRGLARGIHPPVLSESGLKAALENVTEALPVDVDLDVPDDRFDTTLETTAYYTVSEALANTVKHADASHVRVTVKMLGGQFLIQVTDDGKGGATISGGGGIAGLGDRVRALGGEFTLSSPERCGTRLTASIPWSSDARGGW
ncbi:integral membrane sensor signal transduction histidine kinase [Parafrankia sp. EAN1pec]|uniref:sensor histidine kinase n=1 Tax=Parafrankia sp. (strain EAN1pec) TaxID=298653 RepID=UPI00005435DD|nr:integral membrane sensor signal transduction histidine kinase [Frankia sp. EAN1pec]